MTSRFRVRRAPAIPPLLVRITVGSLIISGVALSCSDGPAGPDGPPVASLLASRDSVVIEPGDSTDLRAEARDSAGLPMPTATIHWRSQVPAVAIVSPAGVLRAEGAGLTRIVASARGASDTIHVTVLHPLIETTLSSRLDTITAIGYDAQVDVEDATGTLRVTARGAGATHVVVRERHGTADSVRVVVVQRPYRLLVADPFTGAVGSSVQLETLVHDENNSIIVAPRISWSSGDPAIAHVSASGLVTLLAPGRSATSTIGPPASSSPSHRREP
jgi:hypothetical protein